jgi:hypothetical protein
VTKVGGDDEEVGGVGEIGCEKGAVAGFRGRIRVADHEGDKGNGGGGGLEGGVFAVGRLVYPQCEQEIDGAYRESIL